MYNQQIEKRNVDTGAAVISNFLVERLSNLSGSHVTSYVTINNKHKQQTSNAPEKFIFTCTCAVCDAVDVHVHVYCTCR